VRFIRGRPGEVVKKGDNFIVRTEDTLKGEFIEIEADMVVLSTAMEPSDGTREIAEILDITVNRVYYLLRRNKTKLNTNTKKYDYDEIESLSKSGMKPKEISEKLDIPLRSVYYILNKK
ncbi:MAG: hypothetical protein J6M91_02170, partial [Methanobrevibacter sp.]|nr:hypothetical protein [Methanobrevibacter sp.]